MVNDNSIEIGLSRVLTASHLMPTIRIIIQKPSATSAPSHKDLRDRSLCKRLGIDSMLLAHRHY